MRDVEELSEELDVRDTDGRPVDKISDTTLGTVAAEINPDDFEQPLVQQVRDMNRRKELRPVGLPCGVATVDGKALGKLKHDAKGHALKQTDTNGKEFWYVRVLRAVLSSAAGKPCIGQRTIPGREGEDRPAWCARGTAVIALGWLRIFAYNIVQGLRKRHLLRHHPLRGGTSPRSWRSLFRLVARVLPDLDIDELPPVRDASSGAAPAAAPT